MYTPQYQRYNELFEMKWVTQHKKLTKDMNQYTSLIQAKTLVNWDLYLYTKLYNDDQLTAWLC